MKPNHKKKLKWHELIDKKFVAVYIALALVFIINQVIFTVLLTDREAAKAAGNTYYVDATLGVDSNPGTLLLPWKTLAKVNTPGFAYGAGDSILFKRGEIFIGSLKPDYNGSSGTPILYSDYGNPLDAAPIIRKDPAVFSYVVSIRNDRHDINITNLQLDGGVGCNQIIQLFNSLDTSTVSNILIDNVVLNGPYWGIRAGGGSYANITMSNLSFPGITTSQWGIDFSAALSSSNITIDSVTINGTNQAVIFGAISGLNISNSTITNNTASAITLGSATIASSDITITDSDLSTNGASSLRITGGALSNLVLDHVHADNNTQHGINATAVISGTNEIKNNSTFNGNLSTGITFSDISNLTISDSEASDNHNLLAGSNGIELNGNIANIILDHVTVNNNGYNGLFINTITANNITIRNNSHFDHNGTFTSPQGNGLSMAGAGDTANITGATSSLNGGDGFNVHGTWTNVIFDNCISDSNGTDGLGSDGDGFSYHDSTTGIIRHSVSSNNLKSAIAHINGAQVDMYYNLFYNATNGTIPLIYLESGAGIYHLYNNVIYSGGDNAGPAASAMIDSGGVATFKNNIIYAAGAGDRTDYGILGTSADIEDYNLIFGPDVALYSGGIQQGAVSALLHVNPQFVNAVAYDFHLQSSSPAIDDGIDLGLGYALDLDGLRAPVGDFDIGAYEYPLGMITSSLKQYKSDGITEISAGAWTNQDPIIIKFLMDSRDNPDTLTPQAEVRKQTDSFTNIATDTGAPVAFNGSQVSGSVNVSGLTSGESYHWQAGFTNPTIESAWLRKGGSPDFKVDFVDPTFTEVEGVDAGPVLTDTINYLIVDASSGVNVTDLTVKYGFSADAICDATDIYGVPFTSGVDFIISGVHSDYLCLTAADNAGNIAYHSAGQLNTTDSDILAPTFTVNDGVSLVQTTSDTINVTVNDPNLDPTTVQYAFSSDSICNASDTYSTLFTSGITFTILPTHHEYLCLVASDLYLHTAYYAMGRLNVVPTIVTGGPTELAAPIASAPACVAVDVQENNAVVKAIDWKFTDSSFDETGFRLYDPSDPSDYVEVANANINQIQLTGLQTNKAYTRVVVAYKGAITSSSTSPATCYTLANVPKKPSISQTSSDSITLKLDPADGNPLGTKYAIEETKSHQYVNGSGIFTVTPVWLTYEQWGGENGIKIWGTKPAGIIAQIIRMALSSNTEYSFGVMAENGDGFKTDLSETISGSTSIAAPTNSNTNQPPVVLPTNTNKPPVKPPVTPPITPPGINGNINLPIEPEPGLNENINEPPEIPGATNENTNQAPAEIEPLPIPIIGPILEVFDNPDVEQVSQSLVMPLLITVAAVNTLPAVIILTLYLLPYLHLIFLEPLLLLFRKKRQKWGVVYNSLTKLPVDLALVRLYDKKTNQLVQTKVTDRQGRYVIIVKDPGKYYLSVTKPGFVSPTNLLKSEKQDTKYIDLYHGEALEVTAKDAVLTANIPLDPVEKKSLAFGEIIRSYALKNLRLIISYAGLILALLVVLIVPTAFTIGALIFHIIFFLAFRRFLVPAKAKSWGIVYDAKTKEPLASSVLRIFDLKFNKLLETQVTDRKGRYSFLVGQNQYQLLAEKPGYQNKEVKPVDLVKNEDIVNLDVGLNKI